jgi:hypothetical protein
VAAVPAPAAPVPVPAPAYHHPAPSYAEDHYDDVSIQ